MRVLFALPGLHRYERGAEIAFISVANELAKAGDAVTLIGSGRRIGPTLYRFLRAGSIPRKRFETMPSLPLLRNEYAYEELTFTASLLNRYRPKEYDVTLTCSYPFTNWVLRRPSRQGRRPPHIFVTQNGDWPGYATNSEYRYFSCDGMICTNPDFYERNKLRWRCCVIPNGVDVERFQPGPSARDDFGLPHDRLIVLMVSAMMPSKRIEVGIEAVSQIPHGHLVVAGDGPSRQALEAKAAHLLPGRFTAFTVPWMQMPHLYRSADVFLHLSKEEAFGNVFIEAMACGLPVVGHESPRLRWIVGDHGLLLDTDDSFAIARKIEIAQATAPERRTEGIELAATFSWKKIAQMYRRFMQDVIATSR